MFLEGAWWSLGAFACDHPAIPSKHGEFWTENAVMFIVSKLS